MFSFTTWADIQMAPTKSILTNTLAHLPEDKQQELTLITALIREQLDPKTLEMIILFGSYATGHWVEDTYVEDGVRHDVSRCKYSHSEMGSRLYPIANQAVQR